MRSVTIGLDVSDRYSRMCVLDSKGRVMEEGRVRTSPEGLARRFGCEEPARVVLEVGTHSPWMSEQLKQLGHEVLVANPRRLKLIYGEHDKTDRLDAEHLARVGRMDPKLLKTVQHRGRQARADLAVIRSRDALVKSCTQLVSHVRGAVKSAGCRIPRCSTPAFARTAPEHIPERLKGALEPVLETIAMLTGNIQQYERQIVQLCQGRYPETQQLQQVAGVGALTALAYVLTLEEPERFNTSRAVGPYLGLRPKKRQSGDKDPALRITKAGDKMLRRLLVGSAHYILGPFGPDTELRRWGLKLAGRGGPHGNKKAAVAVARKLAVVLHRLWLSGDEYEPLRAPVEVSAA